MPAEPTTPSDQHPAWSNLLPRLVAVVTLVVAPFVGSTAVASAGQDALGNGAVAAPYTVEVPGQAALIQSGLATHADPPVDGEATAESDDPWLSGWAQLVILAVAAVVFLLVFGRRVVAVIDRRSVSWVDAWAKTVVIVVALIVSIVIVPAKVLELGPVQDMSRAAQDLITVGLWSGALVVALFVLWYAHRESRI